MRFSGGLVGGEQLCAAGLDKRAHGLREPLTKPADQGYRQQDYDRIVNIK